MRTPGEHKSVQARTLAYADAIGWTIVSREEAKEWHGPVSEGWRSWRLGCEKIEGTHLARLGRRPGISVSFLQNPPAPG